ncbi:hypothetical protein EV385_5088 [Krasilnikovia cinnamomea]|uniref:Uncharacterized protein n=1 Tax=Krasilnikovia cinnamomea TaxID=349313 RepID=A0A4V2G7N3_9ACTN|nr:DUF6153 family protein [Krasilnikovia cinnamomea]RZU53196.1 hypothetical protein EV385_5088 [Krasilnikovia cinnamomea]
MLLLCTLLGLSAMHILGHAGMHEPAGHAVGVHVGAGGPEMRALAWGDGCVGCVHVRSHDSDGDGGMSGWSVCLAVLTGFAVLLMLASLLRAVVDHRRPPGAGGGCGGVPARSPPDGQVGLVLATVSVLRV